MAAEANENLGNSYDLGSDLSCTACPCWYPGAIPGQYLIVINCYSQPSVPQAVVDHFRSRRLSSVSLIENFRRLRAGVVLRNNIIRSVYNRDDSCFARSVIRHLDVGNWRNCSKPTDVDCISPIRKSLTGAKIMYVVAADGYVVHRTIGAAVVVAGTYAEGRIVEIVVSNCQVVDGVVANGELHSVAVAATENRIVCIQHVIERCADRMGNQAIVTVGSDTLIWL